MKFGQTYEMGMNLLLSVGSRKCSISSCSCSGKSGSVLSSPLQGCWKFNLIHFCPATSFGHSRRPRVLYLPENLRKGLWSCCWTGSLKSMWIFCHSLHVQLGHRIFHAFWARGPRVLTQTSGWQSHVEQGTKVHWGRVMSFRNIWAFSLLNNPIAYFGSLNFWRLLSLGDIQVTNPCSSLELEVRKVSLILS